MTNLFKNNVEINSQNLLRWRDRYEKTEYPEKIVINIFYDLIPIQYLWVKFNPIFSNKLYGTLEEAIDGIEAEFRINQISIRHNLLSMLKMGVKIGKLNSKNYDKLILQAKNKSNKAIEELEYSYITRVAIKTALSYWFALGIMGYSKEVAYNEIFSIQFPQIDMDNFDEVFSLFAQACVNEISGLRRQDGSILTQSIYRPLPDFW